jgi:hypothetical protein
MLVQMLVQMQVLVAMQRQAGMMGLGADSQLVRDLQMLLGTQAAVSSFPCKAAGVA